MSDQKSMPSPAAMPPRDDQPRLLDKAELIARLAHEMRVASGGELPLSFCVAQVKRKLAGKHAETAAANGTAALSAKPEKAGGGSVFHSWALGD